MGVTAVILAAGRGERFGSDKVLARLGGKPVWRWSFETLLSHPAVSSVGIVASETNINSIRPLAPEAAFVVTGGATRQESSRIAAEAAAGDILLIHDAARPFVSHGLIDGVLAAINQGSAGAPAVRVSDTIRHLDEAGATLLDRENLFGMQTPQGARRADLLTAHSQNQGDFTDELGLLDSAGFSVQLTPGDPQNFKITTSDDLAKARGIVGFVETRTGLGYDIHAFSHDANRPMMLGGVRFEVTGLEGHSDADVLLHAATDALLGAASLGDIGVHFPNTDPRWKGEPSLTFLRHAASLVREAGWEIVNLDVAVIAEQPKIMKKSLEIRQNMADALAVEVGRVSVKATTNERLGSLGREEGIAAFATATIRER